MAEYFGEDLILNELLAVGGMGEVYRATQVGVGGFEKAVAVKRILPGISSQAQFNDMFLRETNISAKLQHPNIVQVFRNGRVDDYLYLVMELVSGQTLECILEKSRSLSQPIPLGLACYIIAEAAKGLDYAHNFADENTGRPLHIVHRDISPSNIMLSYVGEVKLVDFGLAKAANTDKLTQTGELKGKALYLAPELINGLDADRQSDLFTLGVVFYEIVTGVHPFESSNAFHTMQLINDCGIDPPTARRGEVDVELQRIMMRLVERNRTKRYASAGELYKDLAGYMSRAFSGVLTTDLANYLKIMFRKEIAEAQRRRQSAKGSGGVVSYPRPSPSSSKAPVGENTPSLIEIELEKRLARWQRALLVLLVLVNAGLIAYYVRHRPPPPVSEAILQKSATFVPSLLYRMKNGEPRPDDVPSIADTKSPGALPGLVAWFRADSLKLENGAEVSQWEDSGPAGNVARQLDYASQPIFLASAVNGLPALAFDGAARFLNADSVAPSLRGATGVTVFIVNRQDEGKVHYMLSLAKDDRIGDIIRAGYGDGGAKLRVRVAKHFYDSSVQSFLGFGIFTGVYSPEEAAIFYNGLEHLRKKLHERATFGKTTYVTIGQEWDAQGPSDFFNGEISELIIFGRVLEFDERRGVEQYLSDKYKIRLVGSGR